MHNVCQSFLIFLEPNFIGFSNIFELLHKHMSLFETIPEIARIAVKSFSTFVWIFFPTFGKKLHTLFRLTLLLIVAPRSPFLEASSFTNQPGRLARFREAADSPVQGQERLVFRLLAGCPCCSSESQDQTLIEHPI